MNPNLKKMLAARAQTNAAAAPGLAKLAQRQELVKRVNGAKAAAFTSYFNSIGVEEFAFRHLGIPKK